MSLRVLVVAVCALSAALGSCGREGSKREVVLYTSCDDYLLKDVLQPFERATGIAVKVVGDTEATKTTGLVQRLLDEKGKADVWWSNEPFGSIRLDEAGVLERYRSAVEKDFGGQWPAEFRSKAGTWYGFGLRARAIVYNTKKVTAAEAPNKLEQLAEPAWKGRVGMARAAFGTTRGHMGAVLLAMGPEKYRACLEGLKANGVRLFDGNSSVVRAVANGEVEVGLTDTDDVYAGERQGWPVAMHVEDSAPGVLVIANTVGKVAGGPNPSRADALIDFLISDAVERVLARSEAKFTPMRPGAAKDFPGQPVPRVEGLDYLAIQGKVPEALRVWDEVFGR